MFRLWRLCSVLLITFSCCNTTAEELVLISNKATEYKIIIPEQATPLEKRSAEVLQRYLRDATSVTLQIEAGRGRGTKKGIYVGHTEKGDMLHPQKLAGEAYLLYTKGNDLFLMGGSGKGLIYGVYTLLERYVGCKKIANLPVIVPERSEVRLPSLNEEKAPQFIYREVYYPSCADAEFLEWNKLQQFEDLWGLWGHSYDKLVPAKKYFKSHPEYYALVKGRRQPSQLCLSNSDVYSIALAELKARIADNPDAIYWSISPNDDNGYCQCDKCSATDKAEGSPAGSLIKFVNRVAANFPDKRITTLAYGYTHKAPSGLKPASNVYIFLSNIDAYRDKPLATEGSASAFRNDLKAWGVITSNLFVWDYVTQFTNYLAPFPNWHTLQANMQYLVDNGVKGVFVQGSGETYGELAELRCYLIARLLEDSRADVKVLTQQFLRDYYGQRAAPHIQEYVDLVQARLLASKRKLDIYGNPVNDVSSWLSPENLDTYSAIFDKAEAATEGNPKFSDRVMKARLSLEYTVLQQARFFGIEKFGVFEKDSKGNWAVKPKLPEKVKRFVANCKRAGVTELSEGGLNPDQYGAEWDAVFQAGRVPTVAVGAQINIKNSWVEDYPAKGARTLIDGTSGYADFSYNWLCFYRVPMVATIDLGKPTSIKTVVTHFLDDPRHWIFTPKRIEIAISTDGSKWNTAMEFNSPAPEEHYEIARKEYAANLNGKNYRYVRITAFGQPDLPEWRYRDQKKVMIACDEIYIQSEGDY
jgi:hypothetical protein